MKNSVSFFSGLYILFSLSVSAQISNAGFEDWDANGNPVGWQANNNLPLYTTIKKTTDRTSGNWALEGDVVPFSILTVGPSVYSGIGAVGFPINFRPGAIKGYYKFASTQDDFLQVQANFRKNGIYIGGAASNLSPTSTFMQFSINSTFITGDVPDTVLIAIFISHNTGFPHLGSRMVIDDLSWGSATYINDNNLQTPSEFKLEQNYPNPFNPTTKIQYSVGRMQHVQLKVYNVLGNEVVTLVDEYKSVGDYEVNFHSAINSKKLPSGVYFYRITIQSDKLKSVSFTETKKMILLR
jgi:hypothetical protein